MQASLPKKSLSGLALGVISTPHAEAADAHGAVASFGEGLALQLIYLPAGLLVAALILEVVARTRNSQSLHGGVLALLVATGVGAMLALAIALVMGNKFGALVGSPFASRGLGIAFVSLSLLACLTKAFSLRFQPGTQESGDSAPARKRGRGRGRGRGRRRRAAGKGIAAGTMLASVSQAAYTLSLAATLGAIFAAPLIQKSMPASPPVASTEDTSTDGSPEEIELDEPDLTQAALPPDEALPTPLATTSPPAERNETIPIPIPTPVSAPEPEPEPDSRPEPELQSDLESVSEIASATTAHDSPDPEPSFQPSAGGPREAGMDPQTDSPNSLPTPPVKPVSTRHGGLAGAETYKKLIQPILRSRCYDCHGEEKQKGDLRLDTPEHIRLGGKSGPAIIAGNPEKSYLFELISLDESEDDIMPPKGKPLSAAQISWIGGWIREGAALGDGISWPSPDGDSAGSLAADPLSASLGSADQKTIQTLLDGGVIVRELSADGNLLEVDYSHADRAKGDLRLNELLPIADNIYTLDLKRTKVTNDELEVLASMVNLRQLHLQRTKVTDAALDHLTGLNHLEDLNLYNTQVSDAGLPALKQLKSLKNLYLWSSKVTADGARELASALGPAVVNMGE